MDRGLQERLAGAVVLVVLGVWLIPWVLDGSAVTGPSPEETVALKLPAPAEAGGSVIRRQMIELNAERGSAVKTSASDSDEAEPAAAAAESPQRTAVPEGPDGSSGPAESATPAANEPSEPIGSPGEAALEPEQRVASADNGTQRTALPDIIAATPVAGWMVQSGSFGNAGNARRQARRIETYGHDARIYEFAAAGGRTMFRVRVGPLETRERAEAMASTLSAHGFVAQLVAPE